MSTEIDDDAQLEIGHVLFMDIVGFSKLLVDQQTAATNRLNQIVRDTEPFRAAESVGKLIRLPTGDGMVLVFFSGPEAPVRCAIEVARALRGCSFGVRMGIHSGPINKVFDVNDRSNVSGTGINMAQRVMDCGDAGHILLSRRVSEDLAQHSRWSPWLHDLGEFEVKHGVKIDIVSLHNDEVGNSLLPDKLRGKKVGSGLRFRSTWIAAAAVGAIVLGGVGVWFAMHRSNQNMAVSGPVAEKSIAIFPFRPLSSQTRDEALENGMADTLITKLSTIAEIIIPSLSSAQKYSEQEHDPIAAGRLLHVRSVLDGTLQKDADRIRVTARLINVADGTSLWADTFDEKFTDVFQVQDAIAQKVAAALALKLSVEENRRLTKRYTANAEAYELYLKGRFYWNKYTPDGFQKSIDYFKQALQKDPGYALAFSGLADSYSLQGEMAYTPSNESFPQARAFAEKALAMDDKLASAHLSLGIVKLFYEWDFPGAGDELRRAKELDPGNAQIYHFYGHYLELVGRVEEGVEETKRGLALDPTNLILSSEVGFGLYLGRHGEAAVAQARKTLELDPKYSYASCIMAWGYELKGMYQEALTELNRARLISDPPDWSWLVAETGYVHARMGRRAEAERILSELETRTANEYIDPVFMAYICIALADTDKAFAWLDKAYHDRSGAIGWIKVEPKFDPIRSDPRFNELLARMGIK